MRYVPNAAKDNRIGDSGILTLSPMFSRATTKGIGWSIWSNELFDRAVLEQKFVLLSLESEWCQDCRDMEKDTYTDEAVQALIEKKCIPVKVDSNARADLSNRFWNYALPGIVIFNSDGSEIVRQQGYMPAQQMASMLRAVINDPSPGPSVKPELLREKQRNCSKRCKRSSRSLPT